MRPLIGPLAYLAALAGLLGGTFFAVVTFLSDPAVSEKETTTARVPPKHMKEADKNAALPRLFETRVGPPVIHPGPPGGVMPNRMTRAKVGQVSENQKATVARQPAFISQGRGTTTSPEETDLSSDHFFSR